MLSMTVNQVKVDAGPLITRFKDAETGNLVYAGMFSPVRWWRLWATLWVSNLLFSVVVGAPGFLLLRFGWKVIPKEVPWQDLVSVSGLGGFVLLCTGLALTVAAVRCVLFLLASPFWFGQASYLSHKCSYRI
jgi:hypothetical protein